MPADRMSARRPIFNHLVAPAAGGPVSSKDAKAMLDAFRAEVLTEAADNLVAACPDHGDADEAWMDCPCEYADELRRTAAVAGGAL
ncbi:hypothetical protein ACFRCI_09600 [Streptomyces sp. NPDC056638]|uniref:hypothetical protein n=1 Tax=Streptomyces sp. NPDC056638 TaxID=3345887 RepID=UPI00368A0ADE